MNAKTVLIGIFVFTLVTQWLVEFRDSSYTRPLTKENQPTGKDPALGTYVAQKGWPLPATVVWLPRCGECSAGVPKKLESRPDDKAVIVIVEESSRSQYDDLIASSPLAVVYSPTRQMENDMNGFQPPKLYHIDAVGRLDYVHSGVISVASAMKNIKDSLKKLSSKSHVEK